MSIISPATPHKIGITQNNAVLHRRFTRNSAQNSFFTRNSTQNSPNLPATPHIITRNSAQNYPQLHTK